MTPQPSALVTAICEAIEPGILYDLHEPPTLGDDAHDIIQKLLQPIEEGCEHLADLRDLAACWNAIEQHLGGDVGAVSIMVDLLKMLARQNGEAHALLARIGGSDE